MGGVGTPTGGMDTNLQDQTTAPLDLYFSRSTGAPTTVAAPTEPIDPVLYDLTVADATNFIAGTWVGVFGGMGRFYFGNVLAKNGNVLTMDTPFDYEFQIGDNVQPLSREMNVDGSETPVTFTIIAGSGGLVIDLTRVIFSMIHGTAGDDGLFGNLAALPRGLVLRKKDGITRNFWNVKSNGEIRSIGYDLDYSVRSGGQGSFGTAARYTWAGPAKHGVAVRLGPGESLDAIVQDPLQTLGQFRLLVGGHETDEVVAP